MRLPIALFAIALGAVELAGALQELAYGIPQSVTDAVNAGALGAVAGAIVLAAGIALLTRSRRAPELALASAFISIPVFIIIGIVKHFAAWPITGVGNGLPHPARLVLPLLHRRKDPLPPVVGGIMFLLPIAARKPDSSRRTLRHCARPLASHGTPCRHNTIPHRCDTRKQCRSADHKRAPRRVF